MNLELQTRGKLQNNELTPALDFMSNKLGKTSQSRLVAVAIEQLRFLVLACPAERAEKRLCLSSFDTVQGSAKAMHRASYLTVFVVATQTSMLAERILVIFIDDI